MVSQSFAEIVLETNKKHDFQYKDNQQEKKQNPEVKVL